MLFVPNLKIQAAILPISSKYICHLYYKIYIKYNFRYKLNYKWSIDKTCFQYFKQVKIAKIYFKSVMF